MIRIVLRDEWLHIWKNVIATDTFVKESSSRSPFTLTRLYLHAAQLGIEIEDDRNDNGNDALLLDYSGLASNDN